MALGGMDRKSPELGPCFMQPPLECGGFGFLAQGLQSSSPACFAAQLQEHWAPQTLAIEVKEHAFPLPASTC